MTTAYASPTVMNQRPELPELGQQPPRVVRMVKFRKLMLLSVLTALGMLALLPIVATFLVAVQGERLARQAVVADGVVVALQAESVAVGAVPCTAEYAFRATSAAGAPLIRHGSSTLSESEYDALHVGSPVKVRYVPSRPGSEELLLAGRSDQPDPWVQFWGVTLVVGSLYGIAASVFLVAFGAPYVRERHLMRWGLAAAGQILTEEPVWCLPRSSTLRFRVRYQFQAETKRLSDGTRAVLPFQGRAWRRGWAPLDAATRRRPIILYDPKKPSRNMLYPPATVTCEGFHPDKQGIPDPGEGAPVPPAQVPDKLVLPDWPDLITRGRRPPWQR